MRISTAIVSIAVLAAMMFWALPAVAGNPCPFHTFEGSSGGAITPMACMVNNEPADALFKKPSVSMSYVNMGDKNLVALTITERFGKRFEWGYAADRLGLGTLPSAIRDATAVDIGEDDVWLHNFNLRMMLLESDTCIAGIAMPEVTAGVHFKVNHGIKQISQRLTGVLPGGLSSIGYERTNGTDFTLTATKTLLPDRTGLAGPLLLTGGLRLSEGAQLGFLGFGDEYYGTFEGSVVYFPLKWLCVAYEYRQKPDPYGRIAGLINEEDDWHAIDVAMILDEHATLAVGYGHLGILYNTEANGTWFLQLKRNF